MPVTSSWFFRILFYFSLSSVIYLTLYMTLSHSLPCNSPSLRYPTDLSIPYQMFRTCLIRKHTYSYVSENNFESSNQIIVPTGYKLYHVQHILYETGLRTRTLIPFPTVLTFPPPLLTLYDSSSQIAVPHKRH